MFRVFKKKVCSNVTAVDRYELPSINLNVKNEFHDIYEFVRLLLEKVRNWKEGMEKKGLRDE